MGDVRRITAAALALLLGAAGALPAQESPGAPGPGGWIGISVDHRLRTGDRGIEAIVPVVAAVMRDSPAHRAGIEPGDTILGVDGAPGNPRSLAALARRLRPGEPVVFTLHRDGSREEVRVVATERPTAVSPPPLPPRVTAHLDSVRRQLLRNLDSLHLRVRAGSETTGRVRIFAPDSAAAEAALRSAAERIRALRFRLSERTGPPRPLTPYRVGREYVAGARVTELNPGLAEYFSVNEGILVTEVVEGTPAAEAGLRAGDVIVSADDRLPASVEALRRILALSRGPVALTAVRKGSPVELRIFR